MKKIAWALVSFLILCIGFFFYSSVLWTDNSQEILDAADKCIKAYDNKEKDPSGISNIANPFDEDLYLICKEQTDFNWKPAVLSQVLLDLLFSEIDVDIENYITSLSSRKWDAELVKEISDKFSLESKIPYYSYADRYRAVCSNWVRDYIFKYTKWHIEENINIKTENKLLFSSARCETLYKTKLLAYESVANSKIQRNVIDWYTADKKTFMTKVKANWEKLLTTFDRYISKFWIIKDQWNTKTKNARN